MIKARRALKAGVDRDDGLSGQQPRGDARLGAIAKNSDRAASTAIAEAAVTQAISEHLVEPSRVGRARLSGDRSSSQENPGIVALNCIVESHSIDGQHEFVR